MQKRMLKGLVLAASLAGFTMNAYAIAPGFYMGLMTGPASNSGGDVQAQIANSASTTTATAKSTQWGTRIYMGNKMNQYAGMEFGLTYFTGVKFDTKNVDTCDSPQVRVRDLDFLGVGSYSYNNTIGLYGKAGVSLTYANTSGSLNPSGTTECGESKNTTGIKPKFAVGVTYDLNQNWQAELSYSMQTVNTVFNSVSLFGFGISYHFVDEYCGQFLC